MVVERSARTIAEACRNLRHHRETGQATRKEACPSRPQLPYLRTCRDSASPSLLQYSLRCLSLCQGGRFDPLGDRPSQSFASLSVLPCGLLLREPIALSESTGYPY